MGGKLFVDTDERLCDARTWAAEALDEGPKVDSGNILDQIESAADLAEIKVSPVPQTIQKINYSHDGMINLLIANRGISQNEIARHFGYSASWVSQIMSSDAFQARLMERAAEIEDPTLRATVEEGLKGILARSMELLKKKLNDDAAPDNLVLRSLELSSRALGYGARDQTVAVQVNVENHLEHLGGRLVDLLNRKKSEIIQPQLEPET